jgi:palmitoyltransferase ZDHHC9/14/18
MMDCLYNSCPFLWTEIHPALPIVFAYLFILALASMLKTSWTDPGVNKIIQKIHM